MNAEKMKTGTDPCKGQRYINVRVIEKTDYLCDLDETVSQKVIRQTEEEG